MCKRQDYEESLPNSRQESENDFPGGGNTWKGQGTQEIGIDRTTEKKLVAIDPRHYRPTEVETLLGDPSRARDELGWQPKTKFHELVKIMVDAEMTFLKK